MIKAILFFYKFWCNCLKNKSKNNFSLFLSKYFFSIKINADTGQKFRYDNLQGDSIKVSNSFFRLGLRRGDVVCLYGSNTPEMLPIFCGVTAIGGIISPAMTQMSVGKYTFSLVLIFLSETFWSDEHLTFSLEKIFFFGLAIVFFCLILQLLSFCIVLVMGKAM